MVKSCVAANCSNKKSPTVSLFNFPKDPELRQKWIKNVQRTRAEWKGPTPNSVLCSEHFESSCFEPCYDLAAKVGIQMRKLKPDAVPTIFKRLVMQLPSQSYGSDDTGPSGLNHKRSSTGSSESLPSDSVSKKSSVQLRHVRLSLARANYEPISGLYCDVTIMQALNNPQEAAQPQF